MAIIFLTDRDGKILDDRLRALETTVEPMIDDIPKVFFGAALPQTKDDTVMTFRYISKTKDINGYCVTKAQGNSSMAYPKKNQTVKLYTDEACTEKLKVNFKGWGEQNKFCLKANWIDLTHARNVVSARLWGDVVRSRADYENIPELLRTSPNQGAVDGFPVKVYADGVYQGRYTLNIPKDAWMANIDDKQDNHCILCGENYVSGCFRAEANIDESDWTDEVHAVVPDIIKTRWNETIRFVMNSTDDEFTAGIGDYFDLESLIDYYLFGLVSCGLDAFGKNQLYMTYDGRKWYASMYDMDSTWGLWWTGQHFVSTEYDRTEFQDFMDGEGNLLYIRLESLFTDTIKARWEELKTGALSIDNIINRFERFTDIVSAELVREDYASTTGNGAFIDIPSQSTNNIQQIREYARRRLQYCDGFISGEESETYIPVEYIEAYGSQYIDTGISGGSNASYELKMSASSENETNWASLFGANTTDEKAIPSIVYLSTQVFANCADTEWLCASNYDTIFTLKYEPTGKLYLNDNEVSMTRLNPAVGAGWGNNNWHLFSAPDSGNYWAYTKARVYSLKMYTDGILVRDFVPVKRKADGVYGLFDNVSQTFFTGSGIFTGSSE